MADVDSAVREQFKQEVIGSYDRAAKLYDRVGTRQFSYFATRRIERLNIPEGARVLDVATGRGALLFLAAEKAGTSGRVIGIDLAPTMITETAAEIAAR